MAYQVLALKYRPQSFAEAIGQETVTRTLSNAINKERLHHAYLFTGPRGVGKTSLARIFAKCLNCAKGPTITPCQQCNSCLEITAGNAMDVQEIDGASNTSVDDIRSLRETIKYTPGSGRYRIYIIDEVHMLSKSAFAALLKTLEEPPDHVRFIFATTDPEKIPTTILSRVLRFDFRRPSTEILIAHLAQIAKSEKIKIEAEGLSWLARQAEGSFRDALSLFDRVISYAGTTIKADDVLQALGITGRAAVLQLLETIIARDTSQTLQHIDQLYRDGQDLKLFGQDLLESIRDVLVYNLVGAGAFPDWGDAEREAVHALAAQCPAADLEYMFHVFHRAYREIVYSPLPKVMLEITVIRLCTRADRQDLTELIGRLDSAAANTASAAPRPSTTRSAPLRREITPPPPARSASVPTDTASWQGFLKFVESKKAPLATVLSRTAFLSEEADTIRVGLPANPAHRLLIEDKTRRDLVTQLAKEYFKKTIVFEETPATPDSNDNAETAATAASIVDDAITILGAKPIG